MLMEIILSIIVPMYNAENSIDKAVLSTVPFLDDAELILVDDGSTDRTKEVCMCYQNDHIRLITNRRAKGVSGARNTGIEEARGQYITFLDSDDQLSCDFGAIVNLLNQEQKGNVQDTIGEMLVYGYETRDIHGTIKSVVAPQINENISITDFVRKHLEDYSNRWLMNPCWNKIYYSGLLKENQILFPEEKSMGEDLNFVLQCLEHVRRIRIIDRIGYAYVQSDGERLTNGFRAEKLDMQVLNYQKYLEMHEKYPAFSMNSINCRFYDDIQSYLDDAYYISGYSLKKSKRILRRIMHDEILMNVIFQNVSNDWKLPYLKRGEFKALHRKMAFRKWKGKMSKWVHRTA